MLFRLALGYRDSQCWSYLIVLSIDLGSGFPSGTTMATETRNKLASGITWSIVFILCGWGAISFSHLTSRAEKAEAFADGIAFADLNSMGKITYWSPELAEVTGYDSSEVIGSDVGFLMPSETLRELHRHRLTQYSSGVRNGTQEVKVRILECWIVNKSGDLFRVEVRIRPVVQNGVLSYRTEIEPADAIERLRPITRPAEEDIRIVQPRTTTSQRSVGLPYLWQSRS
jgi:PAS domain S-box-containing protein